MVIMATMRTPEIMFSATTYFITSAASLGRIPGIDIDDWHTGLVSFVLDKLLEFAKSPGMDLLSLFSGDSDSISDMRQVFQDNHISRLAVADNSFADAVIHVLHPARFLARKLFQSTFGRLRAFGLKALAKLRVMSSGVHSLFAGKRLAVRSGSNVIQPSVNPNRISTRGNSDLFFKDDIDIKDLLVAVIGQCSGFRLLSFKQAALEVTYCELDVFASSMSGYADLFLRFDKVEGSGIQGHGSCPEPLRWTFAFNGSRHSRYCPDNQVGLKLILCLEFIVAEMLKLYLVACVVFFRQRKNIITAVGKPVQRFAQNIGQLFIDLEFTLYCFN